MSVYIIAEIGINHKGDIVTACELINVAVDCGADAVKFQAFDSELLGRPELEQYEFGMPEFNELHQYCKMKGIDFLCTAFDVEWLKAIDPFVKQIKIPSSKLTDSTYLRACGKLGKPIIMSTGYRRRGDSQC